MYCSKCGTQNPESAQFCVKCGQQLLQATPPPVAAPIDVPASAPQSAARLQPSEETRHTSGLAIASLVLGILGVSLLALIFGAIALNAIGKNPNLSGKGLAIAGLVLGIVGMLIGVIVVIALIFSISLAG
jgi:hypothetical protein